jgi:hypothetical protein
MEEYVNLLTNLAILPVYNKCNLEVIRDYERLSSYFLHMWR